MLTHPDTLPCIRIKTTDLKGTLLGFAADVSDGMAHLEEVGCVHRDLATRNVLLTEQLVVSNMQYKHHAVRGVQYSTMQYNAVQCSTVAPARCADRHRCRLHGMVLPTVLYVDVMIPQSHNHFQAKLTDFGLSRSTGSES